MVSVADLLARPGLSLEPTHVPSPDTPVRWVATSELADPTPYLEGGEVLLTTGLETARWRGEWQEYVDRLALAGVAALGLATGLTHRRVPTRLVQACRGAGLNLFEVPKATTFVAVSRAAASLLEAEHESTTRRSLDAQRTLTQAALTADGVRAVVGRLATVVGGGAAMVTREGPATGPTGPRSADLDLGLVLDEVARIRPQGLRAAASTTSGGSTTTVRPLGVRSRPEQWLAVLVPGRPSDTDRVAIDTAASLLGLLLERQQDQRASDRTLRGRALELVLADDPRTARIVLDASATTATAARLPRQARVLRARGPAEALEDALTTLEDERVLAGLLGTELVAVTAAQRGTRHATQLAERGLQVGVGRAVTVDQAAASHDTAGHALAATGPGAPVRSWEDLARGGVVGLLGAERATAFAQSYLAPLSDDPELLATLNVFLVHHGSRGETALELGVHRNTVRNRIDQIESRLGVTLDDPQARVDAWVALQVQG